jgi:hypothetical protein
MVNNGEIKGIVEILDIKYETVEKITKNIKNDKSKR